MMRRFGGNVKALFQAYGDDLLYLAGAGLWSTGAYLVEPIAALFVAGAFCLHFSYLIGKARSK